MKISNWVNTSASDCVVVTCDGTHHDYTWTDVERRCSTNVNFIILDRENSILVVVYV
jgi:hypothetical protein